MFGQEENVDPFDPGNSVHQELIGQAPETWEVMWEIFSVPFDEAAKLRREQGDSVKMYGEMVQRSEAGKAVLEEFVLLVGRVGSESEADSIEEMIFATEYEPPEMPNRVMNVPQNSEVAKMLMTPAMPSAFDTTEMGRTLEIGFKGKETPEMIKVELKFDLVKLLDLSTWGQGKATARMPEFSAQGFSKMVFLKSGMPTMVGTMSPPKGAAGKEAERRVWFAFATAKPSAK